MISVATTLLSFTRAHPAGLECGTDATSRLTVGSTIMNAPTVAAGPGHEADVSATATGNVVTIKPSLGYFFAAKAFGSGATISPPTGLIAMTTNCSNQVYFNGTGTEAPADYTVTVSAGTTKVVVGYAKGPGAVSLITVPIAGGETVCKATEYCCPDAKHCLTPTMTSCAKDATACTGGDVCCPITKICVSPGAPCTSPCADQGSYCW